MRDIYLYGHLAEKFGSHFRYDVRSVQEAMWAIDVNNNGEFFKEIRRDGWYQVVRGPTLEDDQLEEKQLTMLFKEGAFHICPIAEGSGGNVGGIIVGIAGLALMATGVGGIVGGMMSGMAFGTAAGATAITALGMSYGAMTLLGATLMFSGVSQLLSPSTATDYDNRDESDDRKSSLFNGPVNTIEQGTCIPVVFGKHWIGSTVASASLTVEEDYSAS